MAALRAALADARLGEALRRIGFTSDEFRLVGSTIYALYASRHSDARFNNNFFETKLKVAMTARNFYTLPRLVESPQ